MQVFWNRAIVLSFYLAALEPVAHQRLSIVDSEAKKNMPGKWPLRVLDISHHVKTAKQRSILFVLFESDKVKE